MKLNDYMDLNDEIDEYLDSIKGSFFLQNISFFINKSIEIKEKCVPFLDKNKQVMSIDAGPDTVSLDFVQGIEYVEEYLHQLNPMLEADFKEKLSNGVINFSFTDKGNLEDNYLEKVNFDTDVSFYNDKNMPDTLININHEKSTYSTFCTLVHEYFHTVYDARDVHGKIQNWKTSALTELASIFFEFDFIKFMNQKGIPREYFSYDFYSRYQDTVVGVLEEIDTQILLYKKITEGVIDEDSYKIGKYQMEQEQYQKMMAYYKQDDLDLDPEYMSHYLVASPLAYYLSLQNDPQMPQKMLDLKKEINTLSILESLQKVGLNDSKIEQLNFGDIMNQMKTEVHFKEKGKEDGRESGEGKKVL